MQVRPLEQTRESEGWICSLEQMPRQEARICSTRMQLPLMLAHLEP